MSNSFGTSIDEGFFATINNVEQWIAVRGASLANPILMVLGGPGVSFCSMAPLFSPWEQKFTILYWDQPGAGSTAVKNEGDTKGPLTLDRLANDAYSVASLACRLLRKSSLAVLGVSAGSILGLQLASRRPELFSVYAGTGQFVDWRKQDELSYDMILAAAHVRADNFAIAELGTIGRPPYSTAEADAVKAKYAGALTPSEHSALSSLDGATRNALRLPPSDARYLPQGQAAPDQRALAMAAYAKLRPEICAFDARKLGREFDMPVVFLQGALDAFSVTSEVEGFAAEIEAPDKRCARIQGGGHSAFLLRDSFLTLLDIHVRPYAIEQS